MSALGAFRRAKWRWERWRRRDKRAHRKGWRGPRHDRAHAQRAEKWKLFKAARKAWHRVRRSRDYLTPHFKMSEFNCKNGTPVPRYMKRELRKWCQTIGEPMRAKFGPLTVHSGYRTYSYNARVGGVNNSFHIYTIRKAYPAVDFSCQRGTPDAWARLAYKQLNGRGGVGVYPGQHFTHVDMRPLGTRWRG